MDVLHELVTWNAGRDPARLALKFERMAADPFGFLRGSCHLFYRGLEVRGALKKAPLAWACGDLHLENFGSYKGGNRQPYFDLNDFDEAALAPATWDVVRLAASILVAAPVLGLPQGEAVALRDACLDSYGQALVAGKAYWIDPRVATGLVRQLLEALRDRTRPALLDRYTGLHKGHRRFLLDGRRTLAASTEQQARVQAFMKAFAATRPDPAFFKVRDVAIRIAGTGSLGVERYVVLVEGKGSPDANHLLDLKAALPSALQGVLKDELGLRQPRWPDQAHRVVTVQRLMQAVPMAFLEPVELAGRPFVLRGIQPLEDRVALTGAAVGLAELQALVEQMGRLLAWAQLRGAGRHGAATADDLIAYGATRKWRAQVAEAAEAGAQRNAQAYQAFMKARAAQPEAQRPSQNTTAAATRQ